MVERFRTDENTRNMWYEYIGVDDLPLWDEIEVLHSLKKKISKRDLYALYLNSKYWRECRKRVLKRDDWACVKCKSTSNLHVDHMRYGEMGFENIDDMQTLCVHCHADKTKLVDLKATTIMEIKFVKKENILNGELFSLMR